MSTKSVAQRAKMQEIAVMAMHKMGKLRYVKLSV
jgi:hypothetical protein